MANQFTSVATVPGLASELVQPTYDIAVGEAIRVLPTFRAFVHKTPGNPAMRGSSTTLEKFEWFSEAAVTAAKTPLTEELDVDSTKMPAPSKVTVTPKEYGFAVTSTRKLTNRTFAPFDSFKARAIADHQNRVLDSIIQDITITNGTNVSWGGTATSNVMLAATDKLTAAIVRKQVARFRAQGVPTYFGGFYAAIIHPFAVLDLREESGPATWRVPNEYGTDQSQIWAGEFGEFEGVRFVQNPLVRWAQDGSGTGGAQIRSVQTYFLGDNALVEQVYEEPSVVVGPVTDKLQRFATLGWYGDLDWNVYEQKALRRVSHAVSLNTDLV